VEAFHTGDYSEMPMWANVLVAAEEWGCPPWEIAGGNKLQWFFRWTEYQPRREKAKRKAIENAGK